MCNAGEKIGPCESTYRFLCWRFQVESRSLSLGATGPIARLVHAAVASRRAVQEVDPRFSRLAALALVNQTACEPSGDGSRSSQGYTVSASVKRSPREEERGSEFPDSG